MLLAVRQDSVRCPLRVSEMTCNHLQQLFQLCDKNGLKVSSLDLVHFVCKQCGTKEVCPAVLSDEYEALHPEEDQNESQEHRV